ncbi:MAG: hypothetical protein UZ02_AOB001001551 [Nitrosomonas europaea]|nr:MAG: hypothetical protein UZ02_AOB001001551 [Nitrosomonas europaea]
MINGEFVSDSKQAMYLMSRLPIIIEKLYL